MGTQSTHSLGGREYFPFSSKPGRILNNLHREDSYWKQGQYWQCGKATPRTRRGWGRGEKGTGGRGYVGDLLEGVWEIRSVLLRTWPFLCVNQKQVPVPSLLCTWGMGQREDHLYSPPPPPWATHLPCQNASLIENKTTAQAGLCCYLLYMIHQQRLFPVQPSLYTHTTNLIVSII